MFRVGIVGAGFLTRHSLIPALRGMPGARLVAVLDARAEALGEIVQLCPDATLTTDEDRFFGVGMDAVHVATPNHLHEHFACQALLRGLATLVEKPVAHTVASGERIAAAAARGVAMIGYMAKHNAYNREAARLVAAGAIGAPISMVAARLGWRKDDWHSRPRQSGLGCLSDLGIYPVLTAVDLFGSDPLRYQASAWPVGDPERTDVYAQATAWFDDYRYLHFETAATFAEQPASAEISSYTVVGERGVMQVSGSWAMNGSGSLDWCDARGWHRASVPPVDPYLVQYRLLAECLAGRPVPAPVSLDRAVADLRILYAIAEHAGAAAGAGTANPAVAGAHPAGAGSR